jgi:hypothetical protein
MGETFKENIRREKIQLPSMFYFILYKKVVLKTRPWNFSLELASLWDEARLKGHQVVTSQTEILLIP